MPSYSQLVDEQAAVMGVTGVPVVEENFGNASTDGSAIFINRDFFSKVESAAGEGGVRFVLAHELGHIHQGMCGGHEGELSCDEFGARSVAAKGFGSQVIHNVMGALNAESTATHPGAGSRAKRALAAHNDEETKREIEYPEKEKHVTRFPRTR